MLSKKTKYAIVALVHIAKRNTKDPIIARDIADAEKIPYKFLESILLDLKKAAILTSRKGKGGGYLLHRPPQDISLAEIMRLFDGPLALLPCVTHTYYERCEECKDEQTCGIRSVFLELRNYTVELLKGATIANILNREFSLLSVNSDD